MNLVGLRRELESRGWDCAVMNLNENRKVPSPEYIDVQSGADYLRKVLSHVRRGYAVHVRVNGETKKGYLLALAALGTARLTGRPALLTYCGGHQQSFFPAPRYSLRHLAFSFLFRTADRIYCNSEPVKQALLTTGIDPKQVLPIPHFSTHYLEFRPAPLPEAAARFVADREGTFFLYVCFRKEYMLEILAEVIERFRREFPGVGFLLVGTSQREMEPLRQFFRDRQLEDQVSITGSVPHDVFLTMLTHSLAYIRTPLTDGVCSSVLESLALGVPVLASDNGTRPPGAELWKPGDSDSLFKVMVEAVRDREKLVERIPRFAPEDNTSRLADDLEVMCRR
jgi:glycosyltransferase involved in cell wall biosynthesis